ncbi:hypothetical protein QBC32DRAFT_368210 [Pseudoneurospora amorphoporcata]|uniref:Uncharacterized protein n=1 Tax=Pseudoneurospora amorphoporcata TaxID=241081 RepID=A0AAN6SIG6_9PEZI|nr:hypothetical protein QBC32DRAFT_368210 [Pseudoneurospora amorphoporcata]
MGLKKWNPAWREANIWEKPEPARRYSIWATMTRNTRGTDDADPDPDPEAQVQPEPKEEEEGDDDEEGEKKTKKKKKMMMKKLKEKKAKKPSIWRCLATALACDMFKPALPWIAHIHCHFLAFQRLLHHPRGNIRQDVLIRYMGWR